jgi:tetratricopeptide (TPR) repeat protein
VVHGSTDGTRLGRYVVLDEIGVGTSGVVVSAYDPELTRRVALKFLSPDDDGHEGARARLMHEAQVLAKLAHPNVITVYDVGAVDDRVFVAMELVDGATVETWLAAAPRRWDEILAVFVAAGRGLAAAHAANVVHGDFKPCNVLIGTDGRVRVTDFGLARSLHGDPTSPADATRDGIDARADRLSFCVALHEALHGEPLVSREDSFALREPSPRPRIPGWVRRVLVRELTAPASRSTSMDELLRDLDTGPRSLRRKRLTTAGLGTALLGALTAVYLVKHRPPCDDAHERLEPVWNAARRTAVGDALTATQASFAPATAESVTTTLDAYAAAWVDMRVDACEATLVRGEQSRRRLDRRNRCLDDRLAELDALGTVLSRSDLVVATHAGFAVGELQPLQHCADLETLDAELDPPEDPATATAVAALRGDLVQAKALASVGLLDDALAMAQAAHGRAMSIATPDGEVYQPIAAEAEYRLGAIQAAWGDPNAAHASLELANHRSTGARHDVVAAAAAAALVMVTGRDLDDPEGGVSWGRHAAAALDRIGRSGDTEARLRHDLGVVQSDLGDLATGRASLEQALSLLTDAPGNAWWTAAIHRSLGDTLVADGQLDAAAAEYDDAAAIVVTALGERHPDRALSMAGSARVLAARDRPDEARRTLRDAITMVEADLGPSSPRLIALHRQVAELELSQQDYTAAIEALRRAAAISREIWGDHPAVARSMFELGRGLESAGRLDDARVEYTRALSLWERTRGKDHTDVALALTGLGELDLRQGRAREAVPLLERALRLRGRQHVDPQLRAQTQFVLARALDVLDDRPRARELATKARAAFASGKQPALGRAAEVGRWLSESGQTP